MNDLSKLIDKLFIVMDKKDWMSTDEIAHELKCPVPELLPILIYGRAGHIGIFSFKSSKHWKIEDPLDSAKAQLFRDDIISGIRPRRGKIRRYNGGYSKIDLAIEGQLKHGAGKNYASESIPTAEKSGNLFETGSRHPKWKGGIDPATASARARQYKKHGIGIGLAANSYWANNPVDLPMIDSLDDFLNGKINAFVTVLPTSTTEEMLYTLELLHSTGINMNPKRYSEALQQSLITPLRLPVHDSGVLVSLSSAYDSLKEERVTTINWFRS